MDVSKLDSEELIRLALAEINEGSSSDAVVLLKTLLEREPGHVFARYLLAAQHAQMGLMDRAEAGFSATVAAAPEFPIARFQLAQLLLSQARVEEAKAHLKLLAQLPADQALSRYAAALLALADEDLSCALQELEAGLACHQEIPALASDMARIVATLEAAAGAAAIAAVAQGSTATPTFESLPPATVAPLFLTGYGRES